MTRSAITTAALKLPPRHKAKLAEDLLASLSPAPRTWTDAELIKEVEARSAQIDRGEAKLIPLEQVMRRLKRRKKQ